MFIKSFVSVRNFFVSNFFVNVIGFKKSNYYFWLTTNNFISIFLRNFLLLIPFVLTIKITQFFGYDVIYNYDNIYYISNKLPNKIIPILLEFKAYSNDEPTNICDLTYQIKHYNTSIPFNIFATLNIPEKYDFVKLKYLTKGSIKEKHIMINDYKNYLIYNLFEN